jgi:tRNA threonylcarbamoyl adenosine modification protein (Sua5/YciO/YrdC/YwlC family)
MMIELNQEKIDYPTIKKIANVLSDDGVIIYPTDTIYGFGCNIFSKKAINRIYKIKQKKIGGFSFIIPNLSQISKYAIVSDYAYKVMKKLLPGPYTFVLKASKLVPKKLIPNKKTVAIRIPDNQICLEIVKELDRPIISTSVNITGEPNFSEPLEMEATFGQAVDLIVDGGILKNEASSVIDLSGNAPIIIRRGKGDVSMFE